MTDKTKAQQQVKALAGQIAKHIQANPADATYAYYQLSDLRASLANRAFRRQERGS